MATISTTDGSLAVVSRFATCNYKKTTVVITVWLTLTKYPYLEWQWIFFSFQVEFFFPLLPTIVLSELTIYIYWVTPLILQEVGTVYPSRLPCFTRSFWWGPCCSSLQFLVGSLLLIFTVFGVVLVAHLYSFWWGPCCSSLQLSVGSLLLILTVFGGVLVAHLYSFWWGPCCSSLQFLLGSLLLIFTVFGEVLVAHLYSFLWGSLLLISTVFGEVLVAHLYSCLWGPCCLS